MEILHQPKIQSIGRELPADSGDIFPADEFISVDGRVGGEVLSKLG